MTDVILVLLFGYFVFRRITRPLLKSKNQKAKVQIKNKKLFFLIGLLVFFIANIALATRPLVSLYGSIKLLEFGLLIFYLTKKIRYHFQLHLIALFFSLSALFESTLAILQYLNQGSLNGFFYFFGERAFTSSTPGIANVSINGTLLLRPYATFPHPNVLAGYLLVAMVLVWNFVLINKNRIMQVLGAVSLLVSSIALLLTFSRVAILLWVILVFFAVGQRVLGKIKTPREKILTGFLVVIIFALIALLPLTHEVVSRFTQSSLSEESVTERTELLAASWQVMQQHPLLGVGLDNFIPAAAFLQKPVPLGLYLQPVHNIFFLVMTEAGLIGLGLFLWLLAATIRRVYKQKSALKSPFAALLIIVLTSGMFDHYWLTLQQGQLLFATIIGLSWASQRS